MDHELIAQIYSAGVHTSRFEELLGSWAGKVAASGSLGGAGTLKRPEIVEHIRQAVALCDDLNVAAPLEQIEDPMMARPYPVMLSDSHGCIREANAPARHRYAAEHVCGLPFDADAVDAIRRAVTRLAHRPTADPVVIPVRNTDSHQPTVVSVQRSQGPAGGGELVRLVSNELHWPEGLDDLLQSTFGLSSAECTVMRMLAEGATVSRVAALRGSSVPTVRVQVRALYAKTGVRSQVELLRLALGFVSLTDLLSTTGTGSPGVPADAMLYPMPEQRHLMMLPDGRQLEYAEFGDPRGHPVVFFHDEYYGDHWPAEALESPAANGLRIIAPARPHFGRSDGYPAGVDAAAQFALDLEALLRRLRVERFVILARRTGFRFAVEAAHRMPQRTAGIVAVSPALPARSTRDYRHMTRLARFMSCTIFENPALLDLVCRAGIRYFRQMGPRKLAELLNKGSAEDLAVIDDPRCWKLIEAGMRFSSVSGYHAYLHDVRHDPLRAWERTISCPVHMRCLIGSRDPHDRAGRARRCHEAGAELSVRIVEGEGQLFFLSRPLEAVNEVRDVLTEVTVEA